jgi:hypothetical protein
MLLDPRSLDSTIAIEELLRGTKRSVMQFLAAFHQTEPLTKLAVQGFCVVAYNFKTAAFRWAFRPERADDDMAAALD